MNVALVRASLAAVLEQDGVQTSAYVLAQPTPPGIQILPPAPVYDFSVGHHDWTFTVQAFVALNSDIGAQIMLDEMCATTGARSVKALLEADRTLGGLVDSLTVRDQTMARQVEQPPGNPMLLVEWHLTIYGG